MTDLPIGTRRVVLVKDRSWTNDHIQSEAGEFYKIAQHQYELWGVDGMNCFASEGRFLRAFTPGEMVFLECVKGRWPETVEWIKVEDDNA